MESLEQVGIDFKSLYSPLFSFFSNSLSFLRRYCFRESGFSQNLTSPSQVVLPLSMSQQPIPFPKLRPSGCLKSGHFFSSPIPSSSFGPKNILLGYRVFHKSEHLHHKSFGHHRDRNTQFHDPRGGFHNFDKMNIVFRVSSKPPPFKELRCPKKKGPCQHRPRARKIPFASATRLSRAFGTRACTPQCLSTIGRLLGLQTLLHAVLRFGTQAWLSVPRLLVVWLYWQCWFQFFLKY